MEKPVPVQLVEILRDGQARSLAEIRGLLIGRGIMLSPPTLRNFLGEKKYFERQKVGNKYFYKISG